ncbi:hypothetical protein BJY01DRAFT_221391 [Aspergillus pseudoustus]|uniref:Uncharacterized protein n=1 Tax=Aspergillus pseudoustus TaxID=1810923 RepID=A0ABR4JAI9_9EURO
MQTSPSKVPVLHTPSWMDHKSHPCHQPSPNPFRQRRSRGRACSIQQVALASRCKIHRRPGKRDQSCIEAPVACQPEDADLNLHTVTQESQVNGARLSWNTCEQPTHIIFSSSTNADPLDRGSAMRLLQTELFHVLGVSKIDEANLCEYYFGVPDILMIPGAGAVPSLASVNLEGDAPDSLAQDYVGAESETIRTLYDIYHLLNERW